MSETGRHDAATEAAINAELVRLTMGGRPTQADLWLHVGLAARFHAMAANFEDQMRKVGEVLQPTINEMVANLERILRGDV